MEPELTAKVSKLNVRIYEVGISYYESTVILAYLSAFQYAVAGLNVSGDIWIELNIPL